MPRRGLQSLSSVAHLAPPRYVKEGAEVLTLRCSAVKHILTAPPENAGNAMARAKNVRPRRLCISGAESALLHITPVGGGQKVLVRQGGVICG